MLPGHLVEKKQGFRRIEFRLLCFCTLLNLTEVGKNWINNLDENLNRQHAYK